MPNGIADPINDFLEGFADNPIDRHWRWRQRSKTELGNHRPELKLQKQRFLRPTAVVWQLRGSI